MKILRFLSILIFSAILSSSAFALDLGGTMSGGGGGDGVVAEFSTIVRGILDALRVSTVQSSGIDIHRLVQKVPTLNITSTDEQLVVDNEIKDAKNWPTEGRIVINRTRWSALSESQKQLLAIHEVVSVVGYDDRSYAISRAVLRAMLMPSGTFMDMHRGVKIAGNAYTSLSAPDENTCAAVCNADSRCVASVYDYRVQSCSLSSEVLALVPRTDSVTGLKTISFRNNIDYNGGDYQSFETNDPYDCSQRCLRESQCAAFTYNVETKKCWLKSEIVGQRTIFFAIGGVK